MLEKHCLVASSSGIILVLAERESVQNSNASMFLHYRRWRDRAHTKLSMARQIVLYKRAHHTCHGK